MGKILAICTSPRRGTLKTPVPSAVLTPEWGIVGDAHGGSWHRQVSLLSAEKIEAFRQKLWVDYGAFGENLVVEGFDLATLPAPSFFAIGDAVLEMTQIGKECHNDCVIKQQTGECIMPHEGVFARVLHGGANQVGFEKNLLNPEEDENISVSVGKRHIVFEVGQYSIISRLLEGEFLDYNAAVPKSSNTTVLINTEDAIHCITSTIPVIENNQKNPIRCLFDADEMRVSTVSGLGRVVNYTHANVSGDRVEIGFNSKYVLDALNAADTDQVRIELSGQVSPVKVLPMTEDSILLKVMPMMLKNEA